MKRSNLNLNRRQFIDRSVRGVGLCALGAVPCLSARAGENSVANPFAYDIERAASTDPKLVKFVETARLTGLNPESRRLAVGRGDRLYVATAKGVDILDNQGNKVQEIATASPARCVAVAEDDTVYIGLRTHIEVFNAKGQSVASWLQPNRKTWFTGVCVNANDVFAADSANRVILRYDRSGKLIGRVGEKNPDRNIPGLIVPSPYLDVKLGSDGLLWVNDPGRHRVDVFTANGDLEFSWGKPSAAIDGFCGCCNPIALVPLADGRCVTCEKGLPRVKIYSNDHTLNCVVAGPEMFRQNGRAGQSSDRADGTLGGLDAAVDSKSNIYVLDLIAGDIRVMRPKS